jgi:hypothetical protein
MFRAFQAVVYLILCHFVALSHANNLPPYPSDAMMREELRPKGDFREQVYARIALLQVAGTEESRCQSAHQFAHLFYWMNEAERQAIEDDMIDKMSALLDQDTVHGTHKCLSYVIGGIFMTIGPRAMAAVPSLERALKAAELARSAWVNPTECMGFDINFDRKLDYVLRQALVNIDGRKREKGYVLKCPKDGDPRG